jgi:hypothetical protein
LDVNYGIYCNDVYNIFEFKADIYEVIVIANRHFGFQEKHWNNVNLIPRKADRHTAFALTTKGSLPRGTKRSIYFKSKLRYCNEMKQSRQYRVQRS